MSELDYWSRQRVIVSAGGAGIGLAIAGALHRVGAKVWVCDVDEKALDEAESSLPGIGRMICDVSDPEAVERFVSRAADAMSGIDILVNNAGISGPAATVETITTADWMRTIAVNLNGQFFLARAAIPHIKRAGEGSIVCMTSVAGKHAFPLRSPYASSKAAVISLARGLSVELGPHKIRVNAVAPGVVRGERIQRVLRDRAEARGIPHEEMKEIALRAVSLKTQIDADEIAALVMFLCAPTGRAITGQTLSICGGLEYAE